MGGVESVWKVFVRYPESSEFFCLCSTDIPCGDMVYGQGSDSVTDYSTDIPCGDMVYGQGSDSVTD